MVSSDKTYLTTLVQQYENTGSLDHSKLKCIEINKCRVKDLSENVCKYRTNLKTCLSIPLIRNPDQVDTNFS